MNENPDAKAASSKTDTLLAVGLAGLAGLIRLIPHPFSMTPLNALALFGGARLPARLAFALPLLVMVITDLVIWRILDLSPFNPFVYGSLLIPVLLGRLLQQSSSAWKIGAWTLICTLQFFLITNFGVWLGASDKPEKIPAGAAFAFDSESPYTIPLLRYARTPAGLVASYAHGMSFDKNTLQLAPPFGHFGNLLAGDLFFSGLVFGASVLLAHRLGRLATVPSATSPS